MFKFIQQYAEKMHDAHVYPMISLFIFFLFFIIICIIIYLFVNIFIVIIWI